LEACLPHASDSKTVKFLFLPSEHDPDSYIRELGTQAFEQKVQDAMPLSQFLLNEVSAENDLRTAEGRARTQFNAKPMLQAMPPSGLRLQIVRGLAQLTQSTAAEIEGLFELAKPIARTRAAPARSRRTPPIDLERQIMRLLVAHPMLAAIMDEAALIAADRFAPDGGAMMRQLVGLIRQLGPNPGFAALAEHLRSEGSDFDPLIAEIAAAVETDVELARLELAGAVRQTKMKMLKAEAAELMTSKLSPEEISKRFHENALQQKELQRQAEAEIAQR
jgi:DNA primase